jgi:hypothetical protein
LSTASMVSGGKVSPPPQKETRHGEGKTNALAAQLVA